MELPKLLMLLCCATTACLASHHSHVIPVEGYETELQNLGEHVDVPETPVRVIKITKTIAVKVPVPYPVKVVEKVPYPVHVNKPYPVPVPQIIKVPVAHNQLQGHEAYGAGHAAYGSEHDQFQDRQHNGDSYQVQENPHDTPAESDDVGTQSYDGGNQENTYNSPLREDYKNAAGSPGSYYGQESQQLNGAVGSDLDGNNSFESRSYDLAIQNYLNNLRNKNLAGQVATTSVFVLSKK